ncbi:MAG: protein-glutamate O-methyltransferase CheR [Natronospirillum sp.]|uniref:CheR family methyltransferase n=1 Tax=Natronospirillum sp. TaxID=2812955 RepID=UPI0025D232AC|nr:protein-glutamate O-methyltransferase CheR [Natronospirillum sp.]MCH8552844.1 protein-glutamate O-methyltransferase CheR [Natronospirillum sp.]
MPVTDGYEAFTDFLERHSGIALGANKQYLVTSRLRGIVRDTGVNDLGELLKLVERDVRGKLRGQIIDAMTTNETLWFRDTHPFEILRDRLLPEYVDSRPTKPLRIWSAACSTGQEPYSISMILDQFKQRRPGALNGEKITATDISSRVLADAREGEYAMLALGRGLDTAQLKQYFDQTKDGRWKVKSAIAARVEFRPLNLLESYSLLGQFQFVFCRNVLIYFSGDLKRQILLKIHQSLLPGGYLIVGASEAVNGLNDYYEMVHCRPGIVYRKR